MAKVAFKQVDVARLVRGAIDGGMPLGSFAVQLVNGAPALIPIDQPLSTRVEISGPVNEEAAALAAIENLIKLHG